MCKHLLATLGQRHEDTFVNTRRRRRRRAERHVSCQDSAMGAGEDGIFLFLLCFTLLFALNSGSLYNSTDEVVILDHGNFSSTVHGTDTAWVVEFYNTWCGHCVQFAPIWKQFGKDVKGEAQDNLEQDSVLVCTAPPLNVPEMDLFSYSNRFLFLFFLYYFTALIMQLLD